MTQPKRTTKTTTKKTASPAKATAAARAGRKGAGAGAPAVPPRPRSVRTTVVEPPAPVHAPVMDAGVRHDVAGVLVAVAGVAMLIAVLSPGAGILTQAISDALHALLGLGAVIVPAAVVLWSLTFFAREGSVVPGRVAAGLAVIALGCIALLGITTPNAAADPTLLFNPMVLHDRGGYVGNGVAWALLRLLGQPIGIVVLVGVMLAGLVVTGVSVSGVVSAVALRHRERRELARARADARVAQAAQDAREREAAWLAGEPDAGQPAGDWAPTALFDPERPISGARPARPTSVIRRASDEEPLRRAQSFGCGSEPMVGEGAPWDAPDEAEPARPASAAPASATTFLQPATEADDLRAQLDEASRRQPTAAPDRPASRPVRQKSWWDASDDGSEPEEVLGDACLPEEDLPVPGLIDGFADAAPQAPVTPAPRTLTVRPARPSAQTPANASVPTPRPQAAGASAALEASLSALGANVAPPADVLAGTSAADRVSARTSAAALQATPKAQAQTSSEQLVLPWEVAPAPADAAPEQGERPSGPFVLPDPSVLRHNTAGLTRPKKEEAQVAELAGRLQQALTEFGVKAEVVQWVFGPTCTTFEVSPGEGVRVSKFTNLEDDIARVLACESVRVYAPVPGTSYVGIEVPNRTRQTVLFGDVLPYVDGGPLDFAVGLDANGHPVHADLAKLPHLLIAGTTGSGKSVVVNTIVMSMLMRDTPDDVRLIMVDPKQVEFKDYNGIPHLIMPVVTDMRQAAAALQWGVTEMDRRYRVFSNLGVRDLARYNKLVETSAAADREFPLKHLPSIVIIIDELADLMMVAKKDVEASIVRIAQLGRACGIHLVMATQSPRADVVTGLIRANVANRIGLKVAKKTDSQIAIDQSGSEKLLGHGDMLFLQTAWGDKPRRIQGCYLSDEEIAATVEHLKAQAAPEADIGMAPLSLVQPDGAGAIPASAFGPEGEGGGAGAGDDEPLATRAARLVVENQLGSTSMLQRQLKVGYARAGRVMDMLEEMGIVGQANGSKPRDVLVRDLDELETILGGRS